MPKISKINLRQLFAKGVKPTQEAFYNLFDSFWHKDDQIDIDAVKNLKLSLDNKLDNAAKDSLLSAFNDALTEIHKVVESEFKGVLKPSDPTPTEDGSYKPAISSELDKPTEPSSTIDWGEKYPNAGNLRAKTGYDTMFYKKGTVWTRSEVKVTNEGISSQTEFRHKVANRSVSPALLFSEVIGDFDFESITQDVTMIIPPNFNINNATSSDLPAFARFTNDSSLYSDFDYYKSVDIKFVKVGTWNLYVYDKSNLTTPTQTIPITVTSVGVKNYVFTTPIDAKKYFIFISEGVGYYPFTGANTAVNIISGGLNKVSGVFLGIIFYGSKTTYKSQTIVEQINAIKNASTFKFDNNLYSKKYDQIDAIIGESANSLFNISSSGLILSSPGLNNGVILNKQYNLSERFIELKVKFANDTKFYIGTQFSENNVGKAHAVIDAAAKSITIYKMDTTSTIESNVVFPFSIVNDREYVVRFYKLHNLTAVELIDPITGDRTSTKFSQLGQFDRYKFGFISSSNNPIVSSISVYSIIGLRPFIGFYGDSITEGNSVGLISNNPYYKDRFANIIGEKTKQPYYVSGRSAGTIDGVIARMQNEIPYLRPRYVFVTIGTNGGNTEAKLNQLVDYCESFGCKVILNLIPLYDGTTASKNAMIQAVVDQRKLLSVKMNVATSVNADGVTKDNTLFANESGILIHPNVLGNQKIFERALVDIPGVFQEVGIVV